MDESNHQNDCIFCSLPQQEDGPENLIVFRATQAYVLLNRYPYTSGHVMVAPYVHHSSLEELEPAVRSLLMELTSHAVEVLRWLYQPQGFNVGSNIGKAAGAGFAGHVHFHVVPRWVGDTNFISTLGETRVLPEDLTETWRRVRAAWARQFE